MEKLLCPKCKCSLFKRVSKEGSPFAEWMCPVCEYSANELDSRMHTCWLCSGKTLIHLKDAAKDYWWCVNCAKVGVDPDLASKLETMILPDKLEYAVRCLKDFCDASRIKDKSINQFTEYLLSMRAYKDYSLWEQAAASLELKGRGATLPPSLQRKIPEAKIDAFIKLYENCLEVGLTGVDDAGTVWPVHHLKLCIEILQNENIDLPLVS